MAIIEALYRLNNGDNKPKKKFLEMNIHGTQKLYVANNPIIQNIIKKSYSKNKKWPQISGHYLLPKINFILGSSFEIRSALTFLR